VISHPKRQETFATGMVRQKATALFFDKLWVHPALIKGFDSNDELDFHRVPADICMTQPMGADVYYDSWLTQRAFVAAGRAGFPQTDVTETLRRLSPPSLRRVSTPRQGA
jgi:hypothetical protein